MEDTIEQQIAELSRMTVGHLRVTDIEGALYPCPKPNVGYCPRKIVDYGNGEFAAICRDPYEICERVVLTQRDVLLEELDVASFARFLAGPLGIRWQAPVARGDGTWGIGVSERSDTRSRPVFLVLLPETGRFVAVLQRLLLNMSGPFVVVAPTSRHRTLEVQEFLQARGVSFLALENHLLLDEAEGSDRRLCRAHTCDLGHSPDRHRLLRVPGAPPLCPRVI